MYYEVFIPSADSQGFDVSITVDAENWMAALKSGLQRTGEGVDTVRNLMCDIKEDNSIHVTDATTRRVFVLREVSAEEYEAAAQDEPESGAKTVQTQSVQAETVQTPSIELQPEEQVEPASQPSEQAGSAQPATPVEPEPVEPEPVQSQPEPAAPEPAPQPQQPAETPPPQAEAPAGSDAQEPAPSHSFDAGKERMRIGSSTHQALQRTEDEPRVLRETRSKSDANRAVELGRRDEKVSESLIEDIFLEIQDIHEDSKSMEEVVNFVMDMAMDKIGAESGSVLFADVNGRELYFATARGPKAGEIMDFRVPMGKGIVGFCTREGVSLAISDAQNDPRFYKQISESLGYETRGLLCAPIQHEGRVYGALEVINKKSKTGFRADEMNALAYIGRQLAHYVHDQIMRNESIS